MVSYGTMYAITCRVWKETTTNNENNVDRDPRVKPFDKLSIFIHYYKKVVATGPGRSTPQGRRRRDGVIIRFNNIVPEEGTNKKNCTWYLYFPFVGVNPFRTRFVKGQWRSVTQYHHHHRIRSVNATQGLPTQGGPSDAHNILWFRITVYVPIHFIYLFNSNNAGGESKVYGGSRYGLKQHDNISVNSC